jgi:outer membrane protein W
MEISRPKHVLFPVAAALVWLACGTWSMAQESLASSPVVQPRFDEWLQRTRDHLRDRLDVGLKFKWYELSDNKRVPDGSRDYLGSINEQREDEDLTPLPYVVYRHIPYVGVGLGYDTVRSETWTQANSEGKGNKAYTDGTIEICGPVLFAAGYYPNESICTPYIEAGIIFYGADFDHTNPDWRNAHGIKNYQRMRPSVDRGYRFGVGCDINVRERLDAVVYLDKTWVDVELDHYIGRRLQQSGTFPLDHYSYGIGVKYRF